jgi:PIN domain nuclease of toxin-antitoxin system
VSLLLDSHALLWFLTEAPMEPVAAARIADEHELVVVSAATGWELAIKRATGKLRYEGSMVDHIEASGFEPLDIVGPHAEQAGALPDHHRDPFDRLLIAQAQIEGLTLVTRDRRFEKYEVDVLAC